MRIVHANGVDPCTEAFGDPADPTVLLLHGGGQSMLAWEDEFCARLAAGGRYVVRYDGRDAGRSSTGEPGSPWYTLRDLVADAVGVLDALGSAKAHLIGMSQGAAVCQLVALDHPERVASLALASSTPGGPGHPSDDLPPMSEELRAFFAAETAEPDWSSRTAVIDYLVQVERPFANQSRPFDEAAMRDLATRTYDWANNIAAQVTNPFMIDAGPPWRDRLGRIAVPTLMFHGADEPLGTAGAWEGADARDPRRTPDRAGADRARDLPPSRLGRCHPRHRRPAAPANDNGALTGAAILHIYVKVEGACLSVSCPSGPG